MIINILVSDLICHPSFDILFREMHFYQEVAGIAQWEDEQIEYIKEKVSEEGRQEDLKKGKAPAQVTLWHNNVIQNFIHLVQGKTLASAKTFCWLLIFFSLF